MRKRTFYIKTLGCKVNQYESQVIREAFLRHGYAETDSPDRADIFIVNTCTVTSASDSKSIRLIRNGLRKKDTWVVATGCMVEDADLDLSRLSGVKFVIKNKDKYRIAEIVDKGPATAGRHGTRHGGQAWDKGQGYGIHGLEGHTRVFVKVQDGCDNVCSYCKVRLIRGRSVSRPIKEVLQEVRTLIENGSREIVLTGICLGAYGRDLAERLNLSTLVKAICKIDGHWRLRLSSIEPGDIDTDLIQEMEQEDRLCKHLHIPFQSGDDDVLKRMCRPYTRDLYRGIVERLKDAVPDIAISTDIMVGFPGETEKNFQNTVDFIKAVRPMRMHVFPFSKRIGTRAYGFKNTLKGNLKKERTDILLALAKELSREFAGEFFYREVEVLVEDKKSSSGYLQGYTDRYIKVYIEGPDSLRGKLVHCLYGKNPLQPS